MALRGTLGAGTYWDGRQTDTLGLHILPLPIDLYIHVSRGRHLWLGFYVLSSRRCAIAAAIIDAGRIREVGDDIITQRGRLNRR